VVEALKLDLAAEVLASFGQARLPITGSSMFPVTAGLAYILG
jgi:hypothetical protein